MELIKEKFADIYGGRKKVRLNKKEKVLIKVIKTELTKKIGGLGENESKDLEIDKQVKIDIEDMTKKFKYGAVAHPKKWATFNLENIKRDIILTHYIYGKENYNCRIRSSRCKCCHQISRQWL